MSTLYLASTSPARLALLRQCGIEPLIRPSSVDEPAAVRAAEAEAGHTLTTPEMVGLLARAKAEAVLSPEIDGFVLGGDSSFFIDGESQGKPHTPERARERWRAMRGNRGVLYSGLHLIDHRGGSARGAVTRVDSADLRFAADIDDADIEDYIATGEPLEVAGAFTIDGGAAAFIDGIVGSPSTVIGLSIPDLRRSLTELGGQWSALRTPTAL